MKKYFTEAERKKANFQKSRRWQIKSNWKLRQREKLASLTPKERKKYLEKRRARYQKNSVELIRKSMEYFKTPKGREAKLRADKKHRTKHKKKLTANSVRYQRERYKTDPVYREKRLKYDREYRDNPNRREARTKYTMNKYNKNSEFKLSHQIRHRIRQSLKSQKASKLNRTTKLIGCSIKKMKEHLASQFKPGMSWDNYSYRGWHVDHIKPLSKFDLTNPEEQQKAFHYTNLQPMWGKENISKGNR